MTTATTSLTSRRLDLGCGARKLPGYLGIDALPQSSADLVHDLDECPWPLPDNWFEHIVCCHTLGHLRSVTAALEEMHRVCAPGAIIDIVSPHFSSDNQFTDPTHQHAFGYRSMDYFCANRDCKFRYSSTATFLLRETRISFVQAHVFEHESRKPNPFRWIGLEWAINQVPRFYEHFLAFILRANEVYFRLEVVKPSA